MILCSRETEQRVQHYKNWVKLVPTFSDTISGFEKDPAAMDNFIHAVSAYMRHDFILTYSYS